MYNVFFLVGGAISLMKVTVQFRFSYHTDFFFALMTIFSFSHDNLIDCIRYRYSYIYSICIYIIIGRDWFLFRVILICFSFFPPIDLYIRFFLA